MKKFCFIIMSLVVMQATASPVDVLTARSIAQKFSQTISNGGPQRAPQHGNANLVHTELNPAKPGCAFYYIFNTTDNYIIIAGDDRAYEVLGYGDSPIDMSNIPDGMQYWLDCYKQDMEYLHAHPALEVMSTPVTHRVPTWNMPSIEPLLTALWDQSYPYYIQCPVYDGSYSLTGCAATSLSMICYYWKYPTEITSTIASYTTSSLHMTLEPLSPTTFDYNNMLDRYRGNYSTDQANAVAHLMRYVGQAERMDYTPSASGVGANDIARAVKTLGFDNDASLVYKDNYSDEKWAGMIQEELASGRPLEYCGFGGMSGHAFNVDGYDADRDMYHVNWGWSGSGNGYFMLNGFRGGGTTYRTGQLMVIGLQPPATEPTIRVRTTPLEIMALAEKSSSTTFIVKGSLLTNDVTLTLDDPSGVYTLSANRVSLSEASSGKTVRVTYSPNYSGTHDATITLKSAGAEEKTFTIHGTATLETYVPVMLNATNVTSSSFDISWLDNTPTQNVDHYRLERTTVPFNELRLQESFTSITPSSSDCSSSLDDITTEAGWSGNRVYRGDGYIRLGGSSQLGWLKTPSLDMRDNDGLITVKVRARSAGTAGESLLQFSSGDSDTTVVVPNSETDFCVLLRCEPNESATVKLATRVSGQRVMLYDMAVLAGDDYSPIDTNTATYIDNITSKHHMISNIMPGSYSLRVQAAYSDGTFSQWSDRIQVNVDWARGDVNRDGEINIADANTIIGVIQGTIDSRHMITSSDLNGDGEVNVADINALIGIIFGQ